MSELKNVFFHIESIPGVPSLMHNNTTANPLHPLAKELSKLSKKRTKTEDDYAEMSRIEFMAGLYWNDEVGVHWPGENLDKMLVTSAKIVRQGQDIIRGVRTVEMAAKLIYDGPSDRQKLYDFKDHMFVDTRAVKVKTNTVMRTRPRFGKWALKFNVGVNIAVIDPEAVILTMERAGEMVGLSDYRPRYGRFVLKEAKIE